MSKLSDAIAALEAERDELLTQCNRQEEQIARQRGAIMENRARIGQQDKIIQRQSALIANYQSFLRYLGHSADDLKKQEANATELMGSSGGIPANSSEADARVLSSDGGMARVTEGQGVGRKPGLPNPSLLKRLEEANGSGVH